MYSSLIFLSGCLFFPAMFILLQRVLKLMFVHRLNDGDISKISELSVSSIQAILSSVAGAAIVRKCQHDIMKDSHWLTNAYASFGISYFIYDIWAMYVVASFLDTKILTIPAKWSRFWYYVRTNIPMMLHHTVLPCIIYPVIMFWRKGQGDFFVGVFYMIEMAIPFIAIRTILAQLKMKDNPFYIVVGLLMIAAFFICRVLVFPFLYWQYSLYASIPFLEVPFRIPVKCNLGCFSILIFQIYWLVLMIRGAFRVFYKIYLRNKAKRKL
ncbi:hypothetical protein CHS0354_041530 [Potamilus streckersoni]|uniref:TLC domain-containing protein n=1 Tax=Potamilus streckersoni TaxID=2493646 RepID=A0AAE0TAC6_9BIVA|nr:hypothetical protein CHS0354_041530 [Potamilus streckersoni]